jgi:2-oxoisovalerate dehydrogenase E1 component
MNARQIPDGASPLQHPPEPAASLRRLPGFERSPFGKPLIGRDPRSVYGYGYLIRQTEKLILALFGKGLVSGTTHTCIGQELCQMSIVRALDRKDDAVLSNHRNHGHFLTYSGDPLGLVAEIMGREAGVCGGYGGSQHIAYRHFHSNGVQAGMTAIGVGLAKARKMSQSDSVVAVFIGDGTLGEGLLYEALNLASIWKLPILYVVENNGIAQTTYTQHTTGGSILARGQAFGLTCWELDDSDQSFLEDAEKIVQHTRTTQEPGFVVIHTRRQGPHSKGDDLRPESELVQIKARDPLERVGRSLAAAERREIEAAVDEFLLEIERDAMASPESRREVAPSGVYSSARTSAPAAVGDSIPPGATVRGQLNAALTTLLETDDAVVLLGEDLHDPYGGAFKVTERLSNKYPQRVISTPISEAGMTGAAIGLAMAGLRPIQEIMFADFLSLCMDQIYNHAVKFPGMFPGLTVPMIVRTPCGGRRGYGPTHSQSPENLFVSVPGLTIVYPTHRHDCKRLLLNAARCWQQPLLFLEHKLLYAAENTSADYQELPRASAVDLGADVFPVIARRASSQADACIVTWGGMLVEVEKAVKHLEQEEELAVDIVVPALLAPLPKATLAAALLRYDTILIAEESHHEFGVSAELAACLFELGYRGAIVRVGTHPVPIASARSLESEIIPDSRKVAAALLRALGA